MTRVASCSCGNLEVSCLGKPALISMCHCLACQKRTGAPFGIAAFFPKTEVTVRGKAKTFQRHSDNGHQITFHFCGSCGSTVYWKPMRLPEMIAVGVGAFADPDFPKPDREVYTQSRHNWIKPISKPAP